MSQSLSFFQAEKPEYLKFSFLSACLRLAVEQPLQRKQLLCRQSHISAD